ncbi:MAG: hypothetical protein R6X32_09645 [Chloroflexota bacterium]|jgi:hypothetical protein
MSNTRKDILDLLAKGKISADEAADMLSSATAPEPPAAPEPPKPPAAPDLPTKVMAADDPPLPTKNGKKNWFRIRIRDLETGKNKVSVNIPMGMLNVGFKIANRFAPELEGLNWRELQEMMADAEAGLLVDVQDEDSRDHVQIYID